MHRGARRSCTPRHSKLQPFRHDRKPRGAEAHSAAATLAQTRVSWDPHNCGGCGVVSRDGSNASPPACQRAMPITSADRPGERAVRSSTAGACRRRRPASTPCRRRHAASPGAPPSARTPARAETPQSSTLPLVDRRRARGLRYGRWSPWHTTGERALSECGPCHGDGGLSVGEGHDLRPRAGARSSRRRSSNKRSPYPAIVRVPGASDSCYSDCGYKRNPGRGDDGRCRTGPESSKRECRPF